MVGGRIENWVEGHPVYSGCCRIIKVLRPGFSCRLFDAARLKRTSSAVQASRKCDVSENDTRRGTCPLSNTFIRDDDTYATGRAIFSS